ncbi:MAG TPA: beta-eliminating lyase-related protein [Anaeromyxobacteraceae bacterium]|nr:beta-eliminating lyase-related protein [Anaeromyxobacteraceae bacterium]
MTTPTTTVAAARQLASDNFAPVHPRVLERIAAVNQGHAMAYGDDPVTARARAAFGRLFGREVAAHFVFNGTAANNLALSAFARPYGAVVCSDVAHLCNDESTAPERVLGMRVLPVPSRDGKVEPGALRAALGRGHGVHAVKPVALSLTQPTELGTVYAAEELRELARLAHEHGLGVHVDGARLGCAVATLGLSAREMLVETGVDAVSFGGTKQGMLLGEAVVFLRPEVGGEFPYWQKHAMQLASKMRYVSAQFEALLEGDLWVENGRQANAMAQLLLASVRDDRRVEVVYPVQANSVFARIPPDLVAPLQRETFFWPWDEAGGVVRWMCAFDTEPEDVRRFAAQLRAALDRRQAAAPRP